MTDYRNKNKNTKTKLIIFYQAGVASLVSGSVRVCYQPAISEIEAPSNAFCTAVYLRTSLWHTCKTLKHHTLLITILDFCVYFLGLYSGFENLQHFFSMSEMIP